METQSYCQVVPQSYEERVAMYMKLPKKKLAEMLALRDQLDTPKYCKEYQDLETQSVVTTTVYGKNG